MSRYLLLFLLNLPFILASILAAVTDFKLKKSSSQKLIILLAFWVLVLLGLAFAEPIYIWLFTNKLTNTEPLSLFDVIQITAIVITFYIANRTRSKVQTLERRVQELHKELSIKSSKTSKRTK